MIVQCRLKFINFKKLYISLDFYGDCFGLAAWKRQVGSLGEAMETQR